MTTNLRRITIALPPTVDETIREAAALKGVPQSKVVTEILLEFEPTLRNIIKAQKQAKAGRVEEAKRTLQHTFGDMLAEVMQEHLPLSEPKPKRGAKK